MKYTKPEITLINSALEAIQVTMKPNGNFDSNPLSDRPSITVYESDE
jgi:hypothetical protein